MAETLEITGVQPLFYVQKFSLLTKCDEMPQLFNILKGDMAIVGPRAERPEIAKQYHEELPEFALRLQTKAGLESISCYVVLK